MTNTQQQTSDGRWVPAIMEPLQVIVGVVCPHFDCHRRQWFLTRKAYRDHFTKVHTPASGDTQP